MNKEKKNSEKFKMEFAIMSAASKYLLEATKHISNFYGKDPNITWPNLIQIWIQHDDALAFNLKKFKWKTFLCIWCVLNNF